MDSPVYVTTVVDDHVHIMVALGSPAPAALTALEDNLEPSIQIDTEPF